MVPPLNGGAGGAETRRENPSPREEANSKFEKRRPGRGGLENLLVCRGDSCECRSSRRPRVLRPIVPEEGDSSHIINRKPMVRRYGTMVSRPGCRPPALRLFHGLHPQSRPSLSARNRMKQLVFDGALLLLPLNSEPAHTSPSCHRPDGRE